MSFNESFNLFASEENAGTSLSLPKKLNSIETPIQKRALKSLKNETQVFAIPGFHVQDHLCQYLQSCCRTAQLLCETTWLLKGNLAVWQHRLRQNSYYEP